MANWADNKKFTNEAFKQNFFPPSCTVDAADLMHIGEEREQGVVMVSPQASYRDSADFLVYTVPFSRLLCRE